MVVVFPGYMYYHFHCPHKEAVNTFLHIGCMGKAMFLLGQ